MEPLFLPVLHSFENNNIFTGSYGKLRFRVTPNIVRLTQKEVNFDESSMKCECWHREYATKKARWRMKNLPPERSGLPRNVRLDFSTHIKQTRPARAPKAYLKAVTVYKPLD